jgi:hypothetical protein
MAALSLGKRELEFPGKYLGELRDATPLLGDVDALRARMEEDAYLLIHGLFEREAGLAARREIVEALAREGELVPDRPAMEAAPTPGKRGGFRGGENALTASPAFQALVRSAPIMGFFERFLGGEPLTYDYK